LNLKLKDIAELLQIPEKKVKTWVEQGKIPSYKIGGQYRFSESEINEWIINNKLRDNLNVSEKIIELSAGKLHVSLTGFLEHGGIYYGIEGGTVAEIINNCVNRMTIPDTVHRSLLLESLLERESMMPTALGKGIAIPHPRNPIITDIDNESLSICFLSNDINYGALDGKNVHTLFIVLSANPKRHLEMLSKISFICQSDDFMSLLKSRADSNSITEYMKRKDLEWIKE
jgi:PTS system nitrogen regulatory IIA component